MKKTSVKDFIVRASFFEILTKTSFYRGHNGQFQDKSPHPYTGPTPKRLKLSKNVRQIILRKKIGYENFPK